jgi:hypothetical protein
MITVGDGWMVTREVSVNGFSLLVERFGRRGLGETETQLTIRRGAGL